MLPISILTSAAFLLVEETSVPLGNHRGVKKGSKNYIRYDCRSHPLSLGFEPAITVLFARPPRRVDWSLGTVVTVVVVVGITMFVVIYL